MDDLTDWLGENRAAGVLAVILTFGGGILALLLIFGLLITLAAMAPVVAGVVMILLGAFAVAALARFRFDTSDDEEESAQEHDSLAVLKERYARGELSEEEFEHQVTMLLDVDEIAGNNSEAELVTEHE